MSGARAIGDGRGQVLFGYPAVGSCDRAQQQYGLQATGCDAPEDGFGSRAIGGNPPPDRFPRVDGSRWHSAKLRTLCIVKQLVVQGAFHS